MSTHEGRCHCGHIRLELREQPQAASECNCSTCRRTAGLWHLRLHNLLDRYRPRLRSHGCEPAHVRAGTVDRPAA
ncbi:GFA family protein [Qipengyuania sp. CAU 1752]